eukprot:1681732-Ditylum_brightwellii.AAC.1
MLLIVVLNATTAQEEFTPYGNGLHNAMNNALQPTSTFDNLQRSSMHNRPVQNDNENITISKFKISVSFHIGKDQSYSTRSKYAVLLSPSTTHFYSMTTKKW